MRKRFLTACWKNLAMINYEIEPSLLKKYVPTGTTLDNWNGKTFVSVVGFLFLNTRLKGIPIPFHRDFEEVNLRFYVKRETKKDIRRGVVFIKEIVPKWALARVARSMYNENYVSMPMRHNITVDSQTGDPNTVCYEWKHKSTWNELRVQVEGSPFLPDSGSEEQFVTEHYWGYVKHRDGGTIEYGVEHPQWELWNVRDPQLTCNVSEIYGSAFSSVLSNIPSSAFLAKGSDIVVRAGLRI